MIVLDANILVRAVLGGGFVIFWRITRREEFDSSRQMLHSMTRVSICPESCKSAGTRMRISLSRFSIFRFLWSPLIATFTAYSKRKLVRVCETRAIGRFLRQH